MSLKQSIGAPPRIGLSPPSSPEQSAAPGSVKTTAERPSADAVVPAYFKVSDAARYCSLSRSQFYKLLSKGLIRRKYCGSRTLIARASLDEFLSNLPDQKPSPPIPDYKNNKVRS